LRAGKDHLKDRWGITTWEQRDNKLGNLFARAVSDIRYTVPSTTDGERFRWDNHPLWDAVGQMVAQDLSEMTCGAEPGVVREIRRVQLKQTTTAMIQGLVAAHSVACGTPPEASVLADAIADGIHNFVTKHPVKFQESRKRAQRRYCFIEAPDPCNVTAG
jgi:hypothetical protein